MASAREQQRTIPSGVRECTTRDIKEASGYKNALDEHAQVRLDHIDDLGMVGSGSGGRRDRGLGGSGMGRRRGVRSRLLTRGH